jgi:hypothetical protein
MSTSVNDSSRLAWEASTIAAAEAYAQAEADAAAEARDAAERQAQQNNNQPPPSSYNTDGVDLPTTNQRALDAFLGPQAARGGTDPGSGAGTSNRTYLEPEDVQMHVDAGFTVLTDEQGRSYLPPQGGHEQITEQAPSSVPAPDHAGNTTASGQGGTSGSPPPNQTSTSSGGVQEPQDAAPPDAPKEPAKIVSGAGAAVDELLNKSPTLRKIWNDAHDAGWEIKFRDGGKSSEADPNSQTIWINRKDIHAGGDPAAKMASLLAHEVGHAGTPFPTEDRVKASNQDDYVNKNTERSLAHEGAAAFHNAQARDEIKANGGPDIGIRGGFDQEYIRIYEQYKSGQITEADAMSQMAYFMALEPQQIEAGRQITKQEVLERDYRAEWEKAHPPN